MKTPISKTVEAHGLKVDFCHASSCPGPDCYSGMATCDTRSWARIDGGPWYTCRSYLRGLDGVIGAESAEQVREHIESGRKQFSDDDFQMKGTI